MLCKLHFTLPSQREFGPPVLTAVIAAVKVNQVTRQSRPQSLSVLYEQQVEGMAVSRFREGLSKGKGKPLEYCPFLISIFFFMASEVIY